jgi:hypothetical protein
MCGKSWSWGCERRKTVFEGREERKNFRFNQIEDLDKLSKMNVIG